MRIKFDRPVPQPGGTVRDLVSMVSDESTGLTLSLEGSVAVLRRGADVVRVCGGWTAIGEPTKAEVKGK